MNVLEKYRKLWEGVNPSILRTIEQAQAVEKRLEAEGFTSYGIYGNESTSAAESAWMVPLKDLLADRFPVTTPIHLVIEGESNFHRVDQLEKWLDSSAWWWGLKWCLRWTW